MNAQSAPHMTTLLRLGESPVALLHHSPTLPQRIDLRLVGGPMSPGPAPALLVRVEAPCARSRVIGITINYMGRSAKGSSPCFREAHPLAIDGFQSAREHPKCRCTTDLPAADGHHAQEAIAVHRTSVGEYEDCQGGGVIAPAQPSARGER